MQYRRAKTPGATYFFTVVTHQRQPIFQHTDAINLLRDSFRVVKTNYPFAIDAIVILPDHLHTIWTLPEGDANFSSRWRRIKAYFSHRCPDKYKGDRTLSQQRRGEQAIWQRRFWEHQIRDETDFEQHVDYIHYNPVKHQLVEAPRNWQHSSFHRFVHNRVYLEDWGMSAKIEFNANIGNE